MSSDPQQMTLFDMSYYSREDDPDGESDPILRSRAGRIYEAGLMARCYPDTTAEQWLRWYDEGYKEDERPVPYNTPICRPSAPPVRRYPDDGVLIEHIGDETVITTTILGVETVARYKLELEPPAKPLTVIPAMTISLWQPWALLAAMGAKRYETRSWTTPYRGWLVIHAAKRWTREEQVYAARPTFARHIVEAGYQPGRLPLGAALGVVRLVADHRVEDIRTSLSEEERSYGNYANGRYAWELADARLFPQPIPMPGQQGIWKWDNNRLSIAQFLA